MSKDLTVSTKKGLWNKLFSEPDPKPTIQDKKQIKKTYMFWRNFIFITLYIACIVTYLGFRNFNIAMPFMESTIGITSEDQGLILAVASIIYGIGKFINWITVDKKNVRILLPINLILANGSTLMISFTPLIYKHYHLSHNIILIYMCLFFGANSWFRSAMFPLCVKSLISWFPNSERSTWWARWLSSRKLGTFFALNFTAFIAQSFGNHGFEAIFIFPFILAFIVCIICFFSLRDRPVSIGLPNVEEICKTNLETLSEKKQEEDKESNTTYFQILKKYILKNKIMWNLGFIYFCVCIFRTGPIDWIFKLLIGDTSKATSLENIDQFAAFKTSILSIIGFLGTFFTPIISKKLFKGNRSLANSWCLFIGSLSMIGIWFSTSSFSPFYDNEILKNIIIFISLGVAGFMICVPHVSISGICAVELSSNQISTAASGFIGLFGYFGYSFGRFFSGKILSKSMLFYNDSRLLLLFWGSAALIGSLLCIPLWNIRANKEYSH